MVLLIAAIAGVALVAASSFLVVGRVTATDNVPPPQTATATETTAVKVQDAAPATATAAATQ